MYTKKRKNMHAACFKTQLISWKTSQYLMILNGEGWHYLAIKNLSVLLRGVT